MPLLAPQSGSQTRARLQHAAVDLHDQPAAGFEYAAAKTRTQGGQVSTEARETTVEVRRRGHQMLAEQKDRVSNLAAAGKKAASKRSVA